MAEQIDPLFLDQLSPADQNNQIGNLTRSLPLDADPFSVVLDRAVSALSGASQMEEHANQLIKDYAEGSASLSEVMVATSKMNIAVQLAVTTLTTAVNTFKEIVQMQV